ncbi:MAG: alpha/beta hydrolase fold domain-containing protein [Opitutaceae bacterium]
MKRGRPAHSFLLSLALALPAAAATTQRDVEYARVGDSVLKLDLHLPAKAGAPAPLIVWVHGGAWSRGSKNENPLAPLVAQGWAVASVDYRLTPVAPFPANVHDIKAAVRFLRARRDEYGLATERVAIAGASAGAHLAALVGVSNGHPELEGEVGAHRDQSSAIQAVVSFYGAANLETILSQSTPFGLGVRIPALQLLLRGQPEEKPALARLASPVAHVDAGDPPLLLLHGDQDPQMPVAQSLELLGAYERAGLKVRFVPLHGSKHGGKEFYDEPRLGLVREFLAQTGVSPAPSR